MGATWTIAELAAEAAAVLADDRPAVNGRVRDLPNERLIRWYATIGLVDPPLARRGRTAVYGRRHLLQIVAVKRRQAAGLTIAQIQTELAGVPDTVLSAVAGLPTTDDQAAEAGEAGEVTPARRQRFWARPSFPEPDAAGPEAVEPVPVAGEPVAVAGAPAAPAAAVRAVHGVLLGPGVTLLLDGGAPIDQDELAAIEAAARPLLDELIRLGRTNPQRRQE